VTWDWKRNTGASWKLMLRHLWLYLLYGSRGPMWNENQCQCLACQSARKSLSLFRREHLDHPVVGYRVFRLFDNGRGWDVNGRLVAKGPLRLAPLNDDFGDWQPGVNVAHHAGHVDVPKKVLGGHVCPDKDHQCGFWILSSLSAAAAKDGWNNSWLWIPVIGAVQGWGKVQEHGDGWRVQYASVLALSLKPPTGVVVPGLLVPHAERVLKQLCREWDVLYVEDFNQLAEVNREPL
jgi:hypothetical protein